MPDRLGPDVRPHRPIDTVEIPELRVGEADLAADRRPPARNTLVRDAFEHRVGGGHVEVVDRRRDRINGRGVLVGVEQPPRDGFDHGSGLSDAYGRRRARRVVRGSATRGLYDPLEPDRPDLEVYAAIVEEFGARTVLDIGCGTGTFACLLASRGIDVIAVDPAAASLDVARAKAGSHQVRWLLGDATTLPPLHVDLATMTGNVAQVFVTDESWAATLEHTRSALRPGGRLVFETRDPADRAWQEWNRERSYARTVIVGVGGVETWVELIDAGTVSCRSDRSSPSGGTAQ